MTTPYVVLLIVVAATGFLQVISAIIQQIIVCRVVRAMRDAQASHNKLAKELASEAMDSLLAALNRPAFYDLQNARHPKTNPEPEERIREI